MYSPSRRLSCFFRRITRNSGSWARRAARSLSSASNALASSPKASSRNPISRAARAPIGWQDWVSSSASVCPTRRGSGGLRARMLHELRGRHSRFALKESREIAGAHRHPIRKTRDFEILGRIGDNPCLQFTNVAAVLCFRLQKRAELRLAARPPQKDDHRTRDETGNISTKIFLNEGQGHIDPRGNPARGVDIPVADEDAVGVDAKRRKSSR